MPVHEEGRSANVKYLYRAISENLSWNTTYRKAVCPDVQVCPDFCLGPVDFLFKDPQVEALLLVLAQGDVPASEPPARQPEANASERIATVPEHEAPRYPSRKKSNRNYAMINGTVFATGTYVSMALVDRQGNVLWYASKATRKGADLRTRESVDEMTKLVLSLLHAKEKKNRGVFLPLLLAVLFLVTSCRHRPSFEAVEEKDIALDSEQRLLAHADEESAKFDRSGFLYEDKRLEAYLNAVARKLLVPVKTDKHIIVKIVRDPVLNAFAYPNGRVYVNTGFLAAMDNEAQLADLLGHEMTHVIRRHTAREFTSMKRKSTVETGRNSLRTILTAANFSLPDAGNRGGQGRLEPDGPGRVRSARIRQDVRVPEAASGAGKDED